MILQKGRPHLQGWLSAADQIVHRALCVGLEEALHFGEANFPAFTERHLWIGLASLRRKMWILLDPELENIQ
jgi:hypothetical protein